MEGWTSRGAFALLQDPSYNLVRKHCKRRDFLLFYTYAGKDMQTIGIQMPVKDKGELRYVKRMQQMDLRWSGNDSIGYDAVSGAGICRGSKEEG